jgi:hypothetical protein
MDSSLFRSATMVGTTSRLRYQFLKPITVSSMIRSPLIASRWRSSKFSSMTPCKSSMS